VRDSAESTDPADPGSAACGPPGQNLCAVDLEGARLNEAWKSFRIWTQPVLAFATPAQAIPAGTPSAAISLALVTSSGLAVTTPVDLAVTVTTSSSTGVFSLSPDGPSTPTITLTIPARTRTTGAFYYRDTAAGSAVLTATAPGVTNGTQTITVTPGAAVALSVSPGSARVPARGRRELSAAGTDAYGNVFRVSAAWSVRPAGIGTLAPAAGATTTFTARRTLGPGTVRAVVLTETGALSAEAGVSVLPGRLRVGSIAYVARKGALRIIVSAVDRSGNPVSAARVSILVRRDGRRYAAARGTTGAAGRTVYRMPVPRAGGCLITTVRGASATGFTWDGRTPRNRFCRPRPITS
jgi:hypothetical protein